ncbi:MAG: CRISPR system precrRNA processing endoribonuclease RAMP protein Cas6 [Deltaproteobacteria bacterium]|nr:CRISPR system precrRNA processing endoribonuclease RAMP protein Cas6 [Deltaproteobacteria bacterium]
MFFGNYRFSCLFENDAQLPPFKGSTFRGVFGRALKNVVCALKRENCDDCLLADKCLYAVVFETRKNSNGQGGRLAAPPHPFVIEPPTDEITHYRKGDRFAFNLLLFGDANLQLPYFVYAFEQMGKIGMGRRVNGVRGHYTLEDVTSGDSLIYSSSDKKLRADKEPEKLTLTEVHQAKGDISVTIRFLTPIRLKFENRLSAELPFHLLVRAMLRRVSSLFKEYGGKEPDLDYKGMVIRAQDVRTAENNLRWHDWRRYSFRQESEMTLGGMIGSVSYEGALGEYAPLMELCSRLHIGKQTTFGLGKFEMEIIS